MAADPLNLSPTARWLMHSWGLKLAACVECGNPRVMRIRFVRCDRCRGASRSKPYEPYIWRRDEQGAL